MYGLTVCYSFVCLHLILRFILTEHMHNISHCNCTAASHIEQANREHYYFHHLVNDVSSIITIQNISSAAATQIQRKNRHVNTVSMFGAVGMFNHR